MFLQQPSAKPSNPSAKPAAQSLWVKSTAPAPLPEPAPAPKGAEVAASELVGVSVAAQRKALEAAARAEEAEERARREEAEALRRANDEARKARAREAALRREEEARAAEAAEAAKRAAKAKQDKWKEATEVGPAATPKLVSVGAGRLPALHSLTVPPAPLGSPSPRRSPEGLWGSFSRGWRGRKPRPLPRSALSRASRARATLTRPYPDENST